MSNDSKTSSKRPSARRISARRTPSESTPPIASSQEVGNQTETPIKKTTSKKPKKRVAIRRDTEERLASGYPKKIKPKPSSQKSHAPKMGAEETTASGKKKSSKTRRVRSEGKPSEPPKASVERALDSLFSVVNKIELDDREVQQLQNAVEGVFSRLNMIKRREGRTASSHFLPGDTGGLADSFRRRSMVDLEHLDIDEFGRDANYQMKVKPLFDFLYNHYFKVQVKGIERIPGYPGAVLVCNNGGLAPLDGAILWAAIKREHSAQRQLRWLIEEPIFHMQFVGRFLNRLGAVYACRQNAERLLLQEELLAVFPEENVSEKMLYRAQHDSRGFRKSGYLKLALRLSVPIIPIAIVGAEMSHPIFYKMKNTPVFFGFSSLLGSSFPTILGSAKMMPLPSRMRISVGEPINDVSNRRPESANDEGFIDELNKEIYQRLESIIQTTSEQ